jgi:hypothetical protein
VRSRFGEHRIESSRGCGGKEGGVYPASIRCRFELGEAVERRGGEEELVGVGGSGKKRKEAAARFWLLPSPCGQRGGRSRRRRLIPVVRWLRGGSGASSRSSTAEAPGYLTGRRKNRGEKEGKRRRGI